MRDSFLILLGVAWFLITGNCFIAGTWMAATILVILTRLKAEEDMMLSQFGESYRIYTEQIIRFLPRRK